jgi:hypothetical protein
LIVHVRQQLGATVSCSSANSISGLRSSKNCFVSGDLGTSRRM